MKLIIMQAPDAAAIRAAITEEARLRGIEHTLKEERHPAAQQRRNMALPRQLLSSLGGVDDQLVQLLEQALDGQFNLANLRLSGSGEPHTEEEVGEVIMAGCCRTQLGLYTCSCTAVACPCRCTCCMPAAHYMLVCCTMTAV